MAKIRTSDQALREAIRAALSDPRLVAGGRLVPERRLAEALGVSRAAVRRALEALEAEGSVTRRQGQGTFVGPPPPIEAPSLRPLSARVSPGEIMEARLALEPQIAAKAAGRASAADVAVLERLARETIAAEDPLDYEYSDDRFHYRIAIIAGNALLVGFLESVREVRRQAKWATMRTRTLTPALRGALAAQHLEIVRAIAAGRPDEARERMTVHLTRVAGIVEPDDRP